MAGGTGGAVFVLGVFWVFVSGGALQCGSGGVVGFVSWGLRLLELVGEDNS